jgi:hypothetical protein
MSTKDYDTQALNICSFFSKTTEEVEPNIVIESGKTNESSDQNSLDRGCNGKNWSVSWNTGWSKSF